MLKLIKHIGLTFGMLALVGFVALLPQHDPDSLLMPMVWGMIGFILIGLTAYVIYGRKKGIFCVLLFGFMICLSEQTFAQSQNETPASEKGASYDIDAILSESGNGNNWCSLAGSFNVDQAIKKGENPPKNDANLKTAIDQANRYSYAYDIAKNKKKKEDWERKEGTYDSALQCAQKLLNKVSEFMLKSDEMAASTVYQVLQKDRGSCWPCGIANLMMGITEEIVLALEDTLKEVALDLLGIMLLFWILYKVTVLIGQWGTANLAEFFTEFLKRIIIAMIAAILLSTTVNNMPQVYSTIFSPFIDATSKLTQKFGNMSVTPNANSMAVRMGAQANLLRCDCCASGSSSDCNGGNVTDFKVKGQNINIIEKESKRELMCMTCSVYKQTAPMVAIGRVLTYRSTHIGWWDRTKRGAGGFALGMLVGSPVTAAAIAAALPNPFGMWIVGMLMIIVFTILAGLVAFKLMDIFLRLGFVLFLTPFLIVTFVFPGTRSYTQRGWNFLVNAMLNILALSIGIAFLLACYQDTLPAQTANQLSALVSQTGDPSNEYATNLYNALIGEDGGALSNTLILIVFLFFGMKVLNASNVVIEALSDTSSGIPAIAGAAVMSAIRTATAPVRMLIAAKLDKKQTPDFIKNKFKKKDEDDSEGLIHETAKFTASKVEKGTNKAGNAVNEKGQKIGNKINEYGKKGFSTGVKMSKSMYGLGAIAGVPLMVASAGMMFVNTVGVKGGSWVASKGIKKTGKLTAKGIRKTGKVVQKRWNKVKRKVKEVVNRIRQLPSQIKRKMKQGLMKIKNSPKHLRDRLVKAFRRDKAKKKYGRVKKPTEDRRPNPGKKPFSWKRYALEETESGINHSLNIGDESVEKTDK